MGTTTAERERDKIANLAKIPEASIRRRPSGNEYAETCVGIRPRWEATVTESPGNPSDVAA